MPFNRVPRGTAIFVNCPYPTLEQDAGSFLASGDCIIPEVRGDYRISFSVDHLIDLQRRTKSSTTGV